MDLSCGGGGGMRVGLLPVLVGGDAKENEMWEILGFWGERRFLTPIFLQGEPGESGSPGVQGEPGVKVSEISEALLPNPHHPPQPQPLVAVTSRSWSSSTAQSLCS